MSTRKVCDSCGAWKRPKFYIEEIRLKETANGRIIFKVTDRHVCNVCVGRLNYYKDFDQEEYTPVYGEDVAPEIDADVAENDEDMARTVSDLLNVN